MTPDSIFSQSSPSMEGAIHPSEPTPRIPPLSTEELRPEWQATLAKIPGDGLKGNGFPHNVLGMLMYSPEILGPFLDYWVTAKLAMTLTVREQELVILRIGSLYRNNYVWKHHVPVAQEFGVNESELIAVCHGRYAETFCPREHALLALADELVSARTISRPAWEEHALLLMPRDVIDLITLVSQYTLFALTNNALQVPLEAPLADIPGLAEMIEIDQPKSL